MTDLRQAAQQALEALHYSKVEAITALREALAQPEQEPVGEFLQSAHGNYLQLVWQPGYVAKTNDKLYTTPPAAQRKPLTHIQAKELVAKYGNDLLKLVFQTEAAHNIKDGT